jgi:hypothetical protein
MQTNFHWSIEMRIPYSMKPIRTHKNMRTLRSLRTKVGPAQGLWSRQRETEALAQRARPIAKVQGIPPSQAGN